MRHGTSSAHLGGPCSSHPHALGHAQLFRAIADRAFHYRFGAMLVAVETVWTWVQQHWGALVLIAGYLPLAFGLYKDRLELRKLTLQIAELQAKVAERESRIEKVTMADI